VRMGVRRAALLQVNGLRVLAIETRSDEETVEAAIAQALAGVPIDRVVALYRIPMDARHNAKVDYAALKRELLRHLR
jgi:olefin beta-lactone synthetase